jgi:hypothetical protein
MSVNGKEFTSEIRNITAVSKESTLSLNNIGFSYSNSQVFVNGTASSNYLITNCSFWVDYTSKNPDPQYIEGAGMTMGVIRDINSHNFNLAEIATVVNGKFASFEGREITSIRRISFTVFDESGNSVEYEWIP